MKEKGEKIGQHFMKPDKVENLLIFNKVNMSVKISFRLVIKWPLCNFLRGGRAQQMERDCNT